jgi:hypothetical protein
MVTDWPGFKVSGAVVAPDAENPVPVRLPERIVTGAVPVEVSVTVRVEDVPNITSPNATLVGLIVNIGMELLALISAAFATHKEPDNTMKMKQRARTRNTFACGRVDP